jgi:hypothetical protein
MKMESKLFDEIILKTQSSENEILTPIDELIRELFDYIDEFIDIIKNIVTKGGLFNESRSGNIEVTKVKKIVEEVTRIFHKIYDMINPPPGQQRSIPNEEDINEFIYILNEDQIPLVLKWMNRVFRGNPRNGRRIYDENDKRKMYDACFAFKEYVDSLRILISRIEGNYDLPIEFELSYHYP